MLTATVQNCGGETRIHLSEGLTSQDLVDFLNDEPHKKDINVQFLSDRLEDFPLPQQA